MLARRRASRASVRAVGDADAATVEETPRYRLVVLAMLVDKRSDVAGTSLLTPST